MNKITITDGIKKYDFYMNQNKYLLGNNFETKHNIHQLFKLFFNSVKSEYRDDNEIKVKIFVDGKEISIKRTFFYEIDEKFSFNEESKLGAKSILTKYFEKRLEDENKFFDTINTIEILFSALEEEMNEDSSIKVDFNSISTKLLMKLFKPYFDSDGEQKDEYDLSYEELIIQQIKIIKSIQIRNYEIENYFLLLTIPVMTKRIQSELPELENSYIFINTNYYNKLMNYDEIAIIEDIVLDLNDLDLVYEQFGEDKGNILTFEEVKMKIMKYIQEKYRLDTVNLVNDINKISL